MGLDLSCQLLSFKLLLFFCYESWFTTTDALISNPAAALVQHVDISVNIHLFMSSTFVFSFLFKKK